MLLFIIIPLAVAALMPLLSRASQKLPDVLASLVMAVLLGLDIYYLKPVAAGQVFT